MRNASRKSSIKPSTTAFGSPSSSSSCSSRKTSSGSSSAIPPASPSQPKPSAEFNRLQTLFAKHRGWGVPHSRDSAQLTVLCLRCSAFCAMLVHVISSEPASPEVSMINRYLLRLRFLVAVATAAFVATLPSEVTAQDRSENTLHKLNESVDVLIKKVSPSVVQILVTGYGPVESTEHSTTALTLGRQRAIGSGFVIDSSGYIITNAHVVAGAQRVQLVVPEGMIGGGSLQAILSARTNIVPAHIVGVAKEIDLALLKADNVNLPALSLAPYRNVRQGEIVLAFGSPEGLRNTVTLGVVSSVARQTDPDSPMVYIQTDAPINPGNSGGPLVNVDGEVVGINTFILSQSGGNEGLGFAIPSSVINVAYQQLRKFGHIHRTQT